MILSTIICSVKFPGQLPAGDEMIGLYLGDYSIRAGAADTPDTLRETAASLKKFYKSMERHGKVSGEDAENSVKEEKPKLELEATLLNISGTNNRKLKEACRTLRDYAIYTDKIRAYTEEMELSEAVDRAMDECIREDVLREFLMKHRAEARAMSIFEYDQERHMQQEREAGIEKGRRIGLAEGEEQLLRRLVQKNLSRGMSISEIAEVLDETEERIREIASEDPGEQAE